MGEMVEATFLRGIPIRGSRFGDLRVWEFAEGTVSYVYRM